MSNLNQKKILLIKIEFDDISSRVSGWVLINDQYYAFVAKGWVDIVIAGKPTRRPPSYSYSKIDMPILVANEQQSTNPDIPSRYGNAYVLDRPIEIKNMEYHTLLSIRKKIEQQNSNF